MSEVLLSLLDPSLLLLFIFFLSFLSFFPSQMDMLTYGSEPSYCPTSLPSLLPASFLLTLLPYLPSIH